MNSLDNNAIVLFAEAVHLDLTVFRPTASLRRRPLLGKFAARGRVVQRVGARLIYCSDPARCKTGRRVCLLNEEFVRRGITKARMRMHCVGTFRIGPPRNREPVSQFIDAPKIPGGEVNPTHAERPAGRRNTGDARGRERSVFTARSTRPGGPV